MNLKQLNNYINLNLLILSLMEYKINYFYLFYSYI